jgi:hypothetical protein
VFLRLNHPRLLAPAFLPRAAALGFASIDRLERGCPPSLFQLPAQFLPGQFPVRRLGSLPLAADLDARGPVPQPDGRTGLVNLLTARPAAAHKSFIDIGGPGADGCKSLVDLGW